MRVRIRLYLATRSKRKIKIESHLLRKIVKAEETLTKLEEKKALKEEEYNEAGRVNDLDKLLTIQKELEDFDMEIMTMMEEWESLEEELKELKESI